MVGIVKAYPISASGSIVVVIPKQAHNKLARHPKGQRFLVKVDKEGRLIYEPIEKEEIANSATKNSTGNKELCDRGDEIE